MTNFKSFLKINSKGKLMLGLILILLVLSGCSFSVNSGSQKVDPASSPSGIFISPNKGNNWSKKSYIANASGKALSFADVDASVIKIDPSDSKAIYFGSIAGGLYYSYDGGDSWEIAKSLGKITVTDLAIDPSSKCIVYAAVGHQLFKSTDCTRTWTKVYVDNTPTVSVSNILVDHFAPENIIIALSRGDILKSTDRGDTWKTIYRLGATINKMVIDPSDSRLIFAATNKGIYRTQDGGVTFELLSEQLKEYKLGNDYRDMLIVKGEESNVIFIATRLGILKSNNNGETWEQIDLITPEKSALINSLAVNPQNHAEIYYVTDTSFYRTLDGGESWTPKQLPTARLGWRLEINPENPNILYMGFKLAAKK